MIYISTLNQIEEKLLTLSHTHNINLDSARISENSAPNPTGRACDNREARIYVHVGYHDFGGKEYRFTFNHSGTLLETVEFHKL